MRGYIQPYLQLIIDPDAEIPQERHRLNPDSPEAPYAQQVCVTGHDVFTACSDCALENPVIIGLRNGLDLLYGLHPGRNASIAWTSFRSCSGVRWNLSRRMRVVSARMSSEMNSSICPSWSEVEDGLGLPAEDDGGDETFVSATTLTERAVRLGIPESPSRRRPRLLRRSCCRDGARFTLVGSTSGGPRHA